MPFTLHSYTTRRIRTDVPTDGYARALTLILTDPCPHLTLINPNLVLINPNLTLINPNLTLANPNLTLTLAEP